MVAVQRRRLLLRIDADGGAHALALGRGDVERAAQRVDARRDVRKPHAAVHHRLRIEPAAVVGIVERQLRAVLRQREVDFGAGGMLERVVDQFADHTVENHLDVGPVLT